MLAESGAAGPSRVAKLPDGLDDTGDSESGSDPSVSIDSENPTEDEKEKNQFTVEYFTAARPAEGREWLYNVKWYRYKDNEMNNTWEPGYNLKASCKTLMRSFWDHVGRHKCDPSRYNEDDPIEPTDDWKEKCTRRLVKTLESKGKARYGPEHSGFTPEPRVEKKKKRKRVSSRAVLSDEDSEIMRARKHKVASKKRELRFASLSDEESLDRASISANGAARVEKRPKKKLKMRKEISTTNNHSAPSARPLIGTALQPLPKLSAKRLGSSSDSSEDIPLTQTLSSNRLPLVTSANRVLLKPPPTSSVTQQRPKIAQMETSTSKNKLESPARNVVPLPKPRVLEQSAKSVSGPLSALPAPERRASMQSLPVSAPLDDEPRLPVENTTSLPDPKLTRSPSPLRMGPLSPTSTTGAPKEVQAKQSLALNPHAEFVPASSPTIPLASPSSAVPIISARPATSNAPAPSTALAVPNRPASGLINQRVDKHRGSQIKIVPARFDPVSSLSTKASIAGLAKPIPSKPTTNGASLPTADTRNSPVQETAPSTVSSTPAEITPLRPLPSLNIFTDNFKDDPTVVDPPASISPTSSVEAPLSASMKKFLASTTRKGAMEVADDVNKIMANTSITSVSNIHPLNPSSETKPQLKVQKKWEGELIVSDSALCRVQVEPIVGASLRLLPVLLRSLTVLELTKSYPVFGIQYFLTAAYDPPTEFARVTADSQNLPFLENLSSFMEYECKASVLVSNASFGTSLFLLYPPNVSIPFINLPPIVKTTATPLVIALLPKKGPRALPLERIKSMSRCCDPLTPRDVTISSNPKYQIAARHFGLTQSLIDYVSGKDFCIYTAACSTDLLSWREPTNWTLDDPESTRLSNMLIQCGAKRKDWLDIGAEIVFLHANTWNSPESLLMSNIVVRAGQSHSQFFRFGTVSAPLPGEKPHIRAVFPTGGILTFTPRAIFENCQKLFQLIDDAGNNPFWQVYIHAETIGLLDLLGREATAPSSCSFALAGILARLKSNTYEKTSICVTSCLPSRQSDMTTTQNLQEAWMSEQYDTMRLCEKNDDSLITVCVSRLLQRFNDFQRDKAKNDILEADVTMSPSSADLAKMEEFVNELVARDLVDMRRQPYLYTWYRQYVMLVGGNPSSYGASGIKVVPPSEFSLSDN